jgi:hypothetical protein
MAESESREFRVRYSLWWFVSWVVIMLIWGYETALSSWAFVNYFNLTGEVPAPPLKLGYGAVVYILLLFIGVYALIQSLIEQKRSRILIDEQNLTYVNWRGRERVVLLSEILELRAYSRVFSGPMGLVVKTSNNQLGLPVHLEKSEELRDLIIARGHLTTAREGWYSTKYRREE